MLLIQSFTCLHNILFTDFFNNFKSYKWTIRLLLDANFSSLNPNYQSWLDQKIINDFCGYDIEFGEDYGILMFYSETSKPDLPSLSHKASKAQTAFVSDFPRSTPKAL